MSKNSIPTQADLVVIGAGPGGYHAAFHAAELGLDVTLIDPEENPGGVCLHRGCIPAKSWLQTADVFSEVANAAEFGVITSAPQLDWEAALARKNGIVSRLHGGLTGLMKQRKVISPQKLNHPKEGPPEGK